MRAPCLTLVLLIALTLGATTCGADAAVPRNDATGTISGPGAVVENSGSARYTIPTQYFGSSIVWNVTGNATLLPDTNREVIQVAVGAVGNFTLAVSVVRAGTEVYAATLTVDVLTATSLPHPNADARLALHLGSTLVRPQCMNFDRLPTCAQVVTRGQLYPRVYMAYVLVERGNAMAGVGGAQFGVNYAAAPSVGVDVYSWSLCASLEFTAAGPNGPWPAPGSGNLVTWDVRTRCQRTEPGGPGTGVVATVGFFYLGAYTPGEIRLTPRPVDNQAKVGSCTSVEDVIAGAGGPAGERLGFASFSADGLTPGFNPCEAPIPVRMTTWSSIKALFAPPAVGTAAATGER